MTAAAFAGIVLAGGTRQLAASAPMATLAAIGWLIAAGLVIILSAAAVRFLRRWRLPRVPFPKEGLGDDAIAMIRQARAEDQAEADEFDAIVAGWDRQQGDGRG